MTSVELKLKPFTNTVLQKGSAKSKHEQSEFERVIRTCSEKYEVENNGNDQNNASENTVFEYLRNSLNDNIDNMDECSLRESSDDYLPPAIDTRLLPLITQEIDITGSIGVQSAAIRIQDITEITKNIEKLLSNIHDNNDYNWHFSISEKIFNREVCLNIKKVSNTSLIMTCNINDTRIKSLINDLNDKLSKKGWSINKKSDLSTNYTIQSCK